MYINYGIIFSDDYRMNDYRLVYLWVERYKNVKNKELYFTLDYNIDFHKSCINATLSNFGCSTQKKNNPLSVIDGYSAIVGSNGSGKSNVLELIKYIVCLGKFPSGDNGATGFLIIESKNENGSIELWMITNDDLYSFNSGKTNRFINFERKKLICYNPVDDMYKPREINIDGDSIYRIERDPVNNKYSNSSIVHNIRQFALFKDGLEKYNLFKKVFENSHACYILQYQEIRVKSASIQSSLGIGKNSVKHMWFKILKNKLNDIINCDDFSFDYFLVCYMLLSSSRYLAIESAKGTKFKYNTNDISLLFTLLGYDFTSNSEVKNALDEAERFLIENNLHYLYRTYRERIGFTSDELKKISDCFNDHDSYGNCIAIPFSEPEKFEYFNYLVGGNELEDVGNNLVRGEDIFSSVTIEGLSSGELNIINFIGNLESKLDCFDGIVPIILFDEVEHTFHPEWQRLLIHTISKVFKQKNVEPQVVLTTHSPFILSDILNRKTMSLGGDKSDEIKSFAANIHDILNADFFMKRSIGESAAELIIYCNQLIRDLNNTDLDCDTEVNVMKARMIIDQVNDPIIKSELNSRLGVASSNQNRLRKRLFELMQGNYTDTELTCEIKKLI